MMSFPSEAATYVLRVREFRRTDWKVYVGWVGLMTGLVLATGGFLVFGHLHGVRYPAEAWLVPAGAALFAASIAVDTIGHRTVYKDAIARGEALVHAITIFCGIGSCILLCVAYSHREAAWIPAMVLTVLSIFYSVVDEGFHWHRYANGGSDRVEMASHVGIFIGHLTMMIGWWVWFEQGYPGVEATVTLLEDVLRGPL